MKKAIIFSFIFLLCIFLPFISQGGSKRVIKKSEIDECGLKNQIVFPSYIGRGINPVNIKEEKDVPLDKLVEQSNLIIVGKVISMKYPTLQMGNFRESPSGFTPCKIEIYKILKGDKNLKMVSIAMPMSNTIGKLFIRWEGPIYGCGLEGVWFLNKSPVNVPPKVVEYVSSKGNYFFANSRERFKKANDVLVDKISSIVKENSKKKKK